MILNINKPKGWTSFDVVAKVRSILRHQTGNKKVKVGHAGTLDPLATGVLLVLTEKDTKNQDQLMATQKEYIAKIALGAWTETYDLEGDINLAENIPTLDDLKQKLPQVLADFTGEIQQTVPPHSAVKVDGQRLYKQAREGTLDAKSLPKRTVTILEIEQLGLELAHVAGVKKQLPVLEIRVACSKGTYIRSLANDFGLALGTRGVLTELTRTKVGNYKIEDATDISNISTLLNSARS